MSFYEIVFSGDTVPGASLAAVKSNLARLFQADEQRIALLFSGRRLVLKNNLDEAAARKYQATLERAGALALMVEMAVQVEEIEMAPPPDSGGHGPQAATPSSPARAKVVPRDVYMAAFVDVDAPDYAIARVGADLQDARAAVQPPDLDLSQLSIAPAGVDLGQVTAPQVALAPDISHLKLV